MRFNMWDKKNMWEKATNISETSSFLASENVWDLIWTGVQSGDIYHEREDIKSVMVLIYYCRYTKLLLFSLTAHLPNQDVWWCLVVAGHILVLPIRTLGLSYACQSKGPKCGWASSMEPKPNKEGNSFVLTCNKDLFADLMSSPTRVGKLANGTQAEQMEGSYRLIDMVNVCGFWCVNGE